MGPCVPARRALGRIKTQAGRWENLALARFQDRAEVTARPREGLQSEGGTPRDRRAALSQTLAGLLIRLADERLVCQRRYGVPGHPEAWVSTLVTPPAAVCL